MTDFEENFNPYVDIAKDAYVGHLKRFTYGSKKYTQKIF
ncbi:hypothetical protein DOK79_000134 [Enterococcus sp. DIV1094]|uniref:Transposase n=1 Tax=Candidatus Enterococcus mangumiae TaxID=2230878 RepID=A0ABZ2SS87_9ENTE